MNRVYTIDIEYMINTVIKKYGFENSKTIAFATLCENYQNNKALLSDVYNMHIELMT